MDNKTIYEEFYGPSMESEISGQEALGSLMGAGAFVGLTVLAGWSVWHFLKNGINAVKKRIKENREKSDKAETVNKRDDSSYIKFSSVEEYSEFLDRFIKAVKGSKSKLSGNEATRYPFLNAFAELFGEKFKITPEPYYDKNRLLEDFKEIIEGTDAPEDELYGESLYLNIHPSTLRRDETSYYNDFVSKKVIVSIVEKSGKYGLAIKGPKKTLVFMEDDKTSSDLSQMVIKYINLLKNASLSQREKIVEDFCYDFVAKVIDDQIELDSEVYYYVAKELGINIEQDFKVGDLNDYYFLEQCFFNVLYTGPKTE